MTDQSTTRRQAVQAVTARELLTVVRSRPPFLLLGAVTAVVFGVVVTGNTAPRYVPTAVDLLLPLELLVPTVAIALGYQTIAADVRRGETDVLDTYPVSKTSYVFGVFLGRAIPLVVILGLPLLLVGAYLTTVPAEAPSFLVTYSGTDSAVVFLRFGLLTCLFGLVVLMLSLAASALAGSRQTALILGVVVLAVVVVGLDLLILQGVISQAFAGHRLTTLLAFSPTSAYRGLVFETVISTAVATDRQQASPLLSVAGLGFWLCLGFGIAVLALERR